MATFLLVWLVAVNMMGHVGAFRVEPIVTQPTPTLAPSSASSAPSPSPVLFFHDIGQLTTCQPGVITWVYQGPPEDLVLLVTNSNVNQASQSPSSATAGAVRAGIDGRAERNARANPGTITEALTTTTDPFGLNFTWQSVNVSQGYYAIVAAVPGFSTESSPFFVSNGTDTSCLTASTPSPSASMSPSSTTPAPTSSPSQIPDQSEASSGSSHVAAIVGGVIGGVVAIFAAVGCLLLRLIKKRSARGMSSGSRRWGGLRSSDSHAEPKEGAGGKRSRSKKTHSPSDSQAPINSASGTELGHSPSSSENNIPSLPPVLEKPLDTGGPFATPERSTTPDPFGDAATPLPTPREPARRTSLSSRDYASYSRSRAGSNPMLPPSARRASMDGHRPELIPMAQSASTSSATRRTPRKPVPQYNATELEAAPSQGSSAHGHSTGNLNESVSGHYNLKSASASVNTLSSNLGLHSPAPGSSPHGLGGKGEFSDPSRPVHYLIPDMPPNGISRS
jgi:hypothetical protein